MAEVTRAERLAGLEALDLGSGSTFLDAGCGAGEVVAEVASRVVPGGCAVGVDLSGDLIDRARLATGSLGDAVRFEIGDVGHLEFDDSTFDAVRCERVLQHLDDDAASSAVAEFMSVCKIGGRVQLVDPVHAQHVVDCADVNVFEMIVRRLNNFSRDPYSGIRLARRLHDAYAVNVGFDAHAWRWPSLSAWRNAIGLEQHLFALVEAQELDEARGRAFVKDLTQREEAGTFCAVSVSYRATGSKPTG
jgi:SAM-dependent methyltransferase